MISQLFILVAGLYVVMHGATLATKYSAQLARSFKISQYAVAFIIVAIISVLPEAFIAITSSLKGVPEFGLGMLLGSNIADLTLVVAIVTIYARRPLKVESIILKSHMLYPFILLLPIILGLDGYFSRTEGMALIILGAIFYYLTLRRANDNTAHAHVVTSTNRLRDLGLFVISVVVLLVGAHFTVSSASSVAYMLGVKPILIGMLIVGLGTTLPELLFSLRAVREKYDSLALGDILGTVLADATIVIGILALINPFSFPTKTVYVAGVFMVAGAAMLFSFMRSGRALTRREGYALVIFWLTFVAIESILHI